jgi:hypothetical protein
MDRVESGDVSEEASFFPAGDYSPELFGIFFAIEPQVTTVVAVRDLRDEPQKIRSLLLGRKNG